MSDTSEALPQARSGVGFGTVVRLLAIALGIMSAVLMARDGFKITLSDYLNTVLMLYDDALTSVALIIFDPLIQAAFAKLREWFDLDLQLHPHWKHAFVLLWLTFSSYARALASPTDLPRWFFLWMWGGICAVVGGVWTGTTPPTAVGVFYWPVATFLLYATGNALWNAPAFYGPKTLRTVFESFVGILRAWYAEIGLSAIAGVGAGYMLFDSGNSGLLALIVFTIVWAVLKMFWRHSLPILLPFRLLARGAWFDYPDALTMVCVDILAVLGGAAFIVWLGHALA